MTKTWRYYILCVCSGTTCDQPYVPVNGEFLCSEEEEGVNCTLHCKDGYSFTQDAVHSYFCAYNGVWEPPYSPDRPDCSGKCSKGVLLLLFKIFRYLLSVSVLLLIVCTQACLITAGTFHCCTHSFRFLFF